MKAYKIIDSHCHIYPDKIARKASDSTGEFYHMASLYDGKISTLLENGTAAGIDHFIVQSVATAPKQVSSINRFIAESVAQYEGRLTGLGTMHPDSENMEAEVEEIIALGLKGVKLHPDIQKVKIDDPRMHKIYELCRGRLPILMHTGDSRFDFSNPNRMAPIIMGISVRVIVNAPTGIDTKNCNTMTSAARIAVPTRRWTWVLLAFIFLSPSATVSVKPNIVHPHYTTFLYKMQ